jgi:hypothetical protein
MFIAIACWFNKWCQRRWGIAANETPWDRATSGTGCTIRDVYVERIIGNESLKRERNHNK